MGKETEAPILSNMSDSEPDHDIVSKSQLKRDSEALKKLGKKLTTYNAEQLATIPLSDKLLEAIDLAHKLSNKRSALKRHFQFIGKILRSIDAAPILQAVAQIDDKDKTNIQAFKLIEHWRDRILFEGDTAIHDYCNAHKNADRQKLRQMWRNYSQTPDEIKKTRIARQLFRDIRDDQ